jgi:hypothetical protein
MQALAAAGQARDLFTTPRLAAGSLPAAKPAVPPNVANNPVASTVFLFGQRTLAKVLLPGSIVLVPSDALYANFALSGAFAVLLVRSTTPSTAVFQFLGITPPGDPAPWVAAVGPVGSTFPVSLPASLQVATAGLLETLPGFVVLANGFLPVAPNPVPAPVPPAPVNPVNALDLGATRRGPRLVSWPIPVRGDGFHCFGTIGIVRQASRRRKTWEARRYE